MGSVSLIRKNQKAVCCRIARRSFIHLGTIGGSGWRCRATDLAFWREHPVGARHSTGPPRPSDRWSCAGCWHQRWAETNRPIRPCSDQNFRLDCSKKLLNQYHPGWHTSRGPVWDPRSPWWLGRLGPGWRAFRRWRVSSSNLGPWAIDRRIVSLMWLPRKFIQTLRSENEDTAILRNFIWLCFTVGAGRGAWFDSHAGRPTRAPRPKWWYGQQACPACWPSRGGLTGSQQTPAGAAGRPPVVGFPKKPITVPWSSKDIRSVSFKVHLSVQTLGGGECPYIRVGGPRIRNTLILTKNVFLKPFWAIFRPASGIFRKVALPRFLELPTFESAACSRCSNCASPEPVRLGRNRRPVSPFAGSSGPPAGPFRAAEPC